MYAMTWVPAWNQADLALEAWRHWSQRAQALLPLVASQRREELPQEAERLLAALPRWVEQAESRQPAAPEVMAS